MDTQHVKVETSESINDEVKDEIKRVLTAVDVVIASWAVNDNGRLRETSVVKVITV